MINHILKRLDKPLLSVAQIRFVENQLFQKKDSYKVMQSAAKSLVAVLLDDFPHPKKTHTIHVILGAGNNAGDGLIAAALLKRQGFRVVAYHVFDGVFSGDANKALQFAQKNQLSIKNFQPFTCHGNDIIIEAIFGIGLSREITGKAKQAIEYINTCKQAQNVMVYAIDIAAGIFADTGSAANCVVAADKTVTFIADKIGLHTAVGRTCSGQVIVDSLAADMNLVEEENIHCYLYDYCQKLSARHFMTNTHKGDFGHALVIGGGQGMFGAAVLSAISVLKSGAGKSSLYSHPDYQYQYHIENLPIYEIMRQSHLHDLSPFTAVILGMGLGRDLWAKTLFIKTLEQLCPKQKLLIDADGLWFLSQYDSALEISVITPHEAEAARLLNTSIETICQNKIKAVISLAKKYHCIAVLKGAGTLISDGDKVYVNTTGNDCLSTAGTGDILAGLIGGYLAQGFSPLDAACYGVYRHGLAADNYLELKKNKSLRASDLWDFM